ncbi:MAG: hypothetical protein NWE89_05040 [Candidatus Bathyarchaeota archaeon]|nr:hypothetical protein [Candidatus Bathyarchaeota archaeon]
MNSIIRADDSRMHSDDLVSWRVIGTESGSPFASSHAGYLADLAGLDGCEYPETDTKL